MLCFQLNRFFSNSNGQHVVPEAQTGRFLELIPFGKILLVVKTEEEAIEILYKITNVTLNLLHIKPMKSYSYQLINN